MKLTVATLVFAAAFGAAIAQSQQAVPVPNRGKSPVTRPAPKLSATANAASSPHASPPDLAMISQQEWERIDRAVGRALDWIAAQQNRDGSFPTIDSGQPAVTSLCIMAFLSAGHQPSAGPYGDRLERAITYVLDCQREDGLFSAAPPVEPVNDWKRPTHTAAYNHAISGVMLGEVYGAGGSTQTERITQAIRDGLGLTRALQERSHQFGLDSGGWRYYRPTPDPQAEQSDLSITGWQIMFMRSAMNAGFDVPDQYVDEAAAYVERCFKRDRREFHYSVNGHHRYATRAVTGAGLLSLYLLGKSNPEIERAAGEWMLSHSFRPYNKPLEVSIDRYHYGAYYCSQAAFQLGGKTWANFYRPLAEVLLDNQGRNGAWESESRDPIFGNVYSTALVVLTLTPPFQLLPIYQR